MILDGPTAAIAAAIVMIVTSLAYIGTSTSSRYRAGAPIWGVGFVLQIVAVLSYVVAAFVETSLWGSTWAFALANTATIGSVGCILLGFRAYNAQPVPGPSLMIVALSFLTGAATVLGSPLSDGSGGSVLSSLVLAGIAAGTVIHALGGPARRHAMGWVLAGGMAVAAIVSMLRAAVILIDGMDSDTYDAWFGQVGENFWYLSVGLVVSIAQFVLRSALANERVARKYYDLPDVLPVSIFLDALRGVLRRAASRTDLVVVIAVLVDDVGAITASFGQEVADATTRVLRSATREFASPIALVGDSEDRTIMLVATSATSPADARRQAGLLYRGVIERFVESKGIVVPGVGVGVATSQTLGYRAEILVEGATIAALSASESDETSVVFAAVTSLPHDPFPADRP
ncbi:hypothetical protein AB0N73_01745 [Microbacterium sp. NPDC089189]|uniref:hypothetical protein n=1 Tax=Microbacterium sp. NPDC089189 TaxID=3154972 RepID=UPI00341EA59E